MDDNEVNQMVALIISSIEEIEINNNKKAKDILQSLIKCILISHYDK